MASSELALVTVLSLLFLGQVSFAETANEQIIKVCQTFGSGVVEPFRGIPFHLSTTCPTTLLHFIHKDVEYKIIITHSLETGLIKKVEFILNKLITVVTDGMITVEDRSVSLPYDHMYKHIHPYGIYTKLKSRILELSVIWRFAGSEIDYLWVELGESNIEEKDALCWQGGTSENVDISPSRFIYKTEGCQTRTSITSGKSCKSLSHFYGCYFIENDDIPDKFLKYNSLCKANIYYYENTNTLECAFYSAVKRYCDMETYEAGWTASKCPKPTCPGDLIYMEQGNPFTPTCSHPNFINSENTVETCVCPAGKVLNNFENSSRCIPKEECPCVYGGKIFAQGENRTTKCQSCTCENGAWTCIKENCQKRCIIEGGSVTTYDGKQYMLPKACTYVASQGLNWTIIIELSEDLFLGKVILQIEQKTYTFSKDSVKFENEEIIELHLTEHVMVFWQSSMYVQVQTSYGMKIQVQVKPKVQLYVTLPKSESGKVKGLCGNHNDDTRDDFICRSEIRESVAEYFALSWVMGTCNSKTPGICSSDVDKYAHQDCSYLMDRSGIFASCHNEVPSEDYVKACEKIVCNCEGNKDCLCVALGNYAKACLNQGIDVGDWRNDTSCVVPCNSGQMFSYDTRSCNSTCQSLAGPDPTCNVRDAPVEGCGCPHGSLLNSDGTCTTRSECQCYYLGKTLKPGNHFIGKTKCNCKDGKLDCREPLGCSHGKTYVNCYNSSINTVNRKCASLGMPEIMSTICESGCYCPDGQYEDHNGTCVAPEDCPCQFSGVTYKSGETVTSDCQACTCKGGLWACVEEACSGNCEVFGNGHYKTFDSKWYNFDGNCEYTLVEDDCGSGHRTFSIRAESVPCCEERLTCSRRITLELQGKDTLNLHDLEVGQIGNDTQLLYSVHTVGLYFEILVPSLDITLIWDKHTRLMIILGKRWKNKVCGLCGNFNNNEQDDLQIRGSKEKTDALTSGNSWKMPVPQCSDATEVQFNCVHFSYCANWAERRCKIISGDIFTACHQKVDYIPYYKACVEESCSCSADQASHGFCTAVAAFAEACCEAGVTVNWRTPERCPIYCDYYNKQNPQSSDATWHYKSCGPLDIKICGKNNISRKLEGCYPTCPEDFPYFNENTKKCSKNCTTEPSTTVSPTTTTESTTTVKEPPTTTTESTTVSPTTVTESTATPTVTPTTATTITTIGSTITPTITSTPSTESTTTVTEPPTTTTESTTVSPTTVTESTATPTVTPTTATTITTIGSTITPTITSTPSTESTITVTEPPTTTTESTTVSPATVTESTATPTVTPTTATTITTIRSTITPTITSMESTTTVTEPPTTTTESTTVSPTTVTESTATPTVTPTTATTITTIGSTITPTITSTPSTESTTTVTEPPTTTTESTTVSPTTVTESTATPTVTPTTATTITTIRSTITPTITSTESTTTVTEPPTTTTESTTVSPTTVNESTATPTVTPTTATTITTIGSTITPPSTESTTTVTEPPTTTTESTTVSPTTVTESTATPTVTPTTATTITTIGSTITPTITSTPSTESTTTVTEPPTTTTESTTVSPTTVTESTATPTVTPTTATTITTVGSTITPTITSTPSTESTTTITEPPTTTTESTTVSPTTVTESTATPTVTPTTATTITTIGSTITPTITSTESTTTVTEPPTTTTESTTVSPTTVNESTATPTVTPTTATTITTIGSTITPPSTESTTTVTEPPTTTTESTTVSPTTVTESTATPTVTPTTATTITTIGSTITPTITSTPSTESTTTVTEPPTTTTESTTVSPTTVTESTATPTVTPTTTTTITTIRSTITPTITSTESTTTVTEPPTTTTESTTVSPTTVTESTATPTVTPTTATTITTVGSTITPTITSTPSTESTTTITEPPTTTTESTTVSPTTVTESTATPTVTPTTATTITTIGSTITPTITSTPSTESTTTVTEPPTTTTGSTTVSPTTVTESTATPTVTPTTATTITTVGSTITPTITSTPSTESTTTVTEPPTTTTGSTTVSPTTVTESTATPTVTPTTATTITTVGSTITPTITSTPSMESTTTVTEPPTTTTGSTTVSPTTVTESTATPTVTPTTATTITTVGSTITPTITSTPSTESTTTVTEPPTTTTESTTVSPTTVTESTATPTVTPTTATTITTIGSTITPTITSTPSTESTTTVTEPPTTTTESTTVSPTTVTESTATPTVTPTTATTVTTIRSTITPTITSTPSKESTTTVTEPPTTTTESTTVSPTSVTESTATPTTATTITTIRSTITPTITSTPSTESTTTVTEPPTTTTESTTVSPTTVTESTTTPTVTSTTTTESTTVSPTTVTESTATPTVTPTTATTITTIGSTVTQTITSTPSTESTTTVTEPPTTTTESTTVSPTTVTESTTTPTVTSTSTTESTTVSPTVTESTTTPTVTPTTATTIITVGSTITPTITSTPSTESTTTVTEPPTTTTGSTTVSPTTVIESTATPTATPTTATTITTIGSTITPTITSTPSTESTTTVTEPPTTTTESTTVSLTTVTESTTTPTVTSTTTTESTTVSPTTVTESTATPTVTPTTATTITTIGSTVTQTITSTPSTESTTTVTEPPTTTTESTTVSPTTVTESTTTPTVTSTSTTESTTVSPTVTESTTTPTVTPTTATTATTIVSTITPTITSTTTESATTTVVCFCRDEKNLRNWSCGQTWTENCIQYACKNRTIFQDKISCPPEVKPDCPNGKLTSVPTDNCCQTWKCVSCSCWDETKLRNWTCGQTWTENCIQYTCNDGRIKNNKVSCSPEVKPDCPNGKMRSVPTDDCCQTWECDCQCQVYGDPHYITFDGTPYDFLEDCSYILVEEKKQKHNFSVIVDNFNCVPDASCVRAVRVQYGKNIITLRIVSDRLIVSEFNNVNVPQPYENQGIRITTSDWKVSVYIDAIRSYVSLTPRRVLVVNLAMAYFHGNTQGQCGVCGGGACVRRNGNVEPNTCCDKTAYSWLYEEKEKPHCKVKDLSCDTPRPTAPQCDSQRMPLCELLNHKAFNECSKKVDLTLLKKNCRFDSCMAKNNSVACGVLEKAASDCQNAGFCVEWRPLTNGSCDVKCPEGMIYKECPSTPTTICEGGRISTKIMDKPTAGCFCPGNKHLAGRYTHTCVSDCTDCVGPHGEPKEPGDVWEANCYLCTCDKITLTQRCGPKTHSSLPTCQDNETLVRFNSTSCCNMAVCVEKTCEHRGHIYKIGERWSDPAQPCVLYSCEISGITIENKLCAEEQCLEGSRVCDKQKGCYTCKNTCSPRMSRVNVTIDGECTDEVELPVCEGQCTSHSRWNDSELRMEKECQCCQEKTSQEKSITLKCQGGSKNTFTYKHIVDCECQICH